MEHATLLSASELRAIWRELGEDENSPDKYELTEYGETIVGPRATNVHQVIIGEVLVQIVQQLGRRAAPEAAVMTATAGIRVPDIVWMPAARWSNVGEAIDAPELVVEVLSPGNRRGQIARKVEAYLASGIREVVVIDVKGKVTYHHPGKEPSPESVFGLALDLASSV